MSGTVVYIDDERVLCQAVEMIFELMDLEVRVRTFTDALAAVDFIRTHDDVLLVFCDFRMPALSGLGLLERIDRPVPFYVVSGDLEVARFTETNPRVTGVLSKPFKAERLIEIVHSHSAATATATEPSRG